ncbi:MAG: hypothetical protein ABI415_06990, partial [Flavitalea sp.]
DCIVGKNVIIHAGTVIGSDGFGFAPQKDGHLKKVPQIGNVVIEDYVERIVEKHKLFKLMLCEQMLENNESITKLLKTLKAKNLDVIGKLIKDGQQKKVFKKGIDIVLLMNTLIGTTMQTFINADFYRTYYNLDGMPHEEYHTVLKAKLSTYIKEVFKAIITT